MKNEHLDNLVNKYLDGASTLAEEEALFEMSDSTEDPLDGWSAYVHHKRVKVPRDLVDQLAVSSPLVEKSPLRRVIVFGAIAAGVALLGLISWHNLVPPKMSDAEKRIKLEEALAMFEEPQQGLAAEQIIYEDEMIIIYTEP